MKTAFDKLFSQKRMILFSKKKQMKNCKRPVVEYAMHRIRSHSELLQLSDNAADSATGRSRRVRLF